MRIHPFLLLALGGCSAIAVNWVPTNEAPHALVPRAPGDVKVVSTPPSEPFAEIGFIEGVPDHNGYAVRPETVLARMREAAGRSGCDYLFITSATARGITWDIEGSYAGVGYHGACLVLLDEAKSAAFVTGPPVPLESDTANPAEPRSELSSQKEHYR